MKNVMTRLLCLIALSASALFLACSETDSPDNEQIAANSPDTQLDGATIVFTKDGIRSVVVKAARIFRWEKEDSTEAISVTIDFYDDRGEKNSTLTADRGLIREKTQKFAVFGHVVAINSDSTVLKTESLFWDPQTELITTKDYVEITRADGDVLTGYGMKADRQLKEIEILSDVAGKVKDVIEEPPPPHPGVVGDSSQTPQMEDSLQTPEPAEQQ